jgi:hypothetical protein
MNEGDQRNISHRPTQTFRSADAAERKRAISISRISLISGAQILGDPELAQTEKIPGLNI